MRKIRLLLATLLILVLSTPAWSGQIGIFQGSASIKILEDGIVVARSKARRAAVKEALMQAVMQSIPSDQYQAKRKAIDKKILLRSEKYIQSFDILSSGPEEGNYNMRIEAKILLDRLVKDIGALDSKPGEDVGDKKRILLVVTNRWKDSEQQWTDLAEPLRERLEIMNLQVLPDTIAEDYLNTIAFARFKERRYNETMDFAARHDARFALIIRAVNSSETSLQCPTLGRAWFIDVQSREVIARVATNFKTDVGCGEVATAGAKTFFSLLAEKLQGRGILDAAPVVSLKLLVYGLKTYRDITELTALLRGTPDVKSIALHSFASKGKVVFRINYEGDTQNLIDAITKFRPVSYKLVHRVDQGEALAFEAIY